MLADAARTTASRPPAAPPPEERIVGFQNALAAVKREPNSRSVRTISLAVLARDIEELAADLHHEVKRCRAKMSP